MTDTLAPTESLHLLLHSLRTTPPRLIQSPPAQPRRASVALIIRVRPSADLAFEGHVPQGWTGPVVPESDFGLGYGIEDFFRLPWVNHPTSTPELLFIRRSQGTSSSSSSSSSSSLQHRWSSHIAFPGGRQEPADESALYTALRETWEEIGVDLAEREFVQVGRLDEREITTSLGKRLLMILSPFVFLQTSPFSPPPELQASEVSSVHWIPFSSLTPPFSASQWAHIEIDISTRLSPRNKFIRWALRGLVGKMEFGCVLLPDEPDHVAEGFDMDMEFVEPAEGGSGSWYNQAEGKQMLRLWGLSLGMTLDLLAHLPAGPSPAPLVLPRSRSSSSASPTRLYGPRTPVTVTSTFDDQWDNAQKAIVSKAGGPASPIQPMSKLNGGSEPSSSNAGDGPGRATGLKTQVQSGSGAVLTRIASMGKVDIKGGKRTRRGVGPGVTAVFPRFSYPDVNFWIWIFGRKYRKVIKGWEASMRGPIRPADRRMNWSGAALSTFYTAVRQALVVAIIIRALATGVGLAGLTWWLWGKWGGGQLGEL